MRRYIIGFYAGAMFVFLAVVWAVTVHAERKPQWKKVECWTNDCIADTLNRLSPENAAEAKLTTWKNTTYVWYSE